jgi:hypothetical protein
LIDRKVNIDELPPEARARVMAQIGEDASKKRVRPEGICSGCGKKKPIYNHLDGDQSKPLCGACNMKLHRQSPGAVQTKVSKIGMQAIGSLDSLLGQPGVEQDQKNVIQQMQDGLKLMVRRWLGDTSVGEEAQAADPADLASAQESTDVPSPVSPRPILGETISEPDPGSLEEFRQTLHRIADTEDMERALRQRLAELVAPLVTGHPHGSVSQNITVRISRPSKQRIDVGDWMEYGGKTKSDRLTEQIGSDRALGCVVGEDMLDRPKVLWHDGKQWMKKPYSLFDPDAVRVLFDWQAAEKYPDAFNSYPRDAGPPEVARIPLSLSEGRMRTEQKLIGGPAKDSDEGSNRANSEQDSVGEQFTPYEDVGDLIAEPINPNGEQVNCEQFTQPAEPFDKTILGDQFTADPTTTQQAYVLPPAVAQRVTKVKQKGKSHGA